MATTVTVGCKLPAGIYMQVGETRMRIKGWNNNEIVGLSHGITHGVPADLWESWQKEHKDSLLVKNGIIFAEESARKVKDKAKDLKEQSSGHEQMPQVKATDDAGVLGKSDA